ncbi:MAG: GH1 family beta-glucosidase [Myxococcota bacterium]
MKTFPKDFLWGVATSCYQIEGAVHADGRGESIWDRFAAMPGKTANGDTGEIACDHYHRWREDIGIMKELGANAYRFSIAWPRILPTGLEARPNSAGLDWYDRLVDGLLELGIEPWVTLYHWDLPQGLQDRGGWVNRETAGHFARLAWFVSERLGDRVTNWITHNEPWCVAMLGHMNGHHAPGHHSFAEALEVAHHVLLSHGLAVPVIRDHVPGARVGITLNLSPATPASPSAADADATRRYDGFFNRWFLDPVYGRGYPEDMIAEYRQRGDLPTEWHHLLQPGDLNTIAAQTDFLGINYYSRAIIRCDRIPEEHNHPRTVERVGEPTDMDWEVYAPGLYQLLMRLKNDYAPPSIYITENGAAYPEEPDENGVVADQRRQDYIEQHLAVCHDAIQQGSTLDGYFAWSFMDNFEWAFGYDKRFGLIHVDYATQKRTIKQSAYWYQSVMNNNALP